MINLDNTGVRPLPENRKLEHGFWNAAVPTNCVVPLQQHAGSSLRPLVSVGSTVREGMVIADGDSRLSVPVHAPIPGRVTAIGPTTLADGSQSIAVAIELAGEFDRLGRRPDPLPWREKDRQELLSLIRAGGVVATPRAPVPAHLLLRPRRGPGSVVLVLDLAEMEPYLTADAELTATAPDEVLTGLSIASRVLGASDVRVVLTRSAPRLRRAIRTNSVGEEITLRTLPHRYPINDPAILRKRLFPLSGRGDRELVVITPSTAYAIHEAVVYGKPQIERVVAVGGGAVRRPAHVRVRIGTAIAEVLEECGGLIEDPERVVVGGPLTGRSIANVNTPLVKSTAAVLALTRSEVRSGKQEPCIGCGACVRACPVALDPILLSNLVESGRFDEAMANGLDTCIECGLCAHVCPSRIPLVDVIRDGKMRSRDS